MLQGLVQTAGIRSLELSGVVPASKVSIRHVAADVFAEWMLDWLGQLPTPNSAHGPLGSQLGQALFPAKE